MSPMTSSAPVATPANPLVPAFEAALRRVLAQQSAEGSATAPAAFSAAALACREVLLQRWADTQAQDAQAAAPGAVSTSRRVHYLSMEFLMGRALGNALAALGLAPSVEAALNQESLSLGDALEREPDAALGNGGLGRLAACFLDSFAELGLPAFGYGLRYRFGMFAQRIQDGRQAEVPDDWLRLADPWDVPRPELRYHVGFGGRVVTEGGARRWVPAERVVAEAHDFIVPAHHNQRVATLRLWQASSAEPIDLQAFCRGDHAAAGRHQLAADTLNWVLYPDDSTEAGRLLRLKQEAFLVSASVQDMVARHLRQHGSLNTLGRFEAIHLNDTHPALAPAELMRVLLDQHGLNWDEAWQITREAVSYTNHTLMPEALETWPVRMMEALLPRHLELIYEINHRYLQEARAAGADEGMVQRISLIDEQGERRVRMASLAVVASHRVNGVSALHSELMVQTLFADYARLHPERFHNVTNGVTPRRWLAQANPDLSTVLDKHLGQAWRQDLAHLQTLAPLAKKAKVVAEVQAAKRANKLRLAERIRRDLGLVVNPDSLFDVQVKRIHEYKRQLLNLLHVVARYQAIIANPDAAWVPRTVVLAGKAASAYHAAKGIIALAHDIARVVNSDPRVGDKLKLAYLPNYGVSLAEIIMPAADLSEQISTAGTEASGTGNMKFSLNGALTIGTWDGANIEMAQAVGEEHFFIFGLRTEAVEQLKALGYDPRLYIEQDRRLQRVLAAIGDGSFSQGDAERYRWLVDSLTQRDTYLLMADFADYLAAQERVDALYADPAEWGRKAVLNIAGMGSFSSDRTVAEYVERVWSAQSLPPAPR